MDTAPLARVEDCQPWDGPIEAVFFPEVSLADVRRRAALVWNEDIVAP